MISSKVLLAISLVPLVLVALVLLGCVIGGRLQHNASRSAHRHDLADTAFWAAVKLDQTVRGAILGTPEPVEPIAETISLYTATLSEVQTFVARAREVRRQERREFGALMRMARTA